MHEGGDNCSIPIAAFVTCQARLKLWRELNKLGLRVLYFDTDSIIFVSKPCDYMPELGDFLGQFTSEVQSGLYIVEFVSAGPKNYAYKLNSGETSCTVKGFTLNHIASQKINYESIKEIVCRPADGGIRESISVEQMKFARNKFTWEIETSIISKLYSFVYDKRILLSDLTTLPYGY